MIKENIIWTFGIIYIGITVLLWCGAVYFMFRVVVLRKEGVNKWRDTGGNPFNLLFMSSKLTNEGLAARKNLFICILTFILMVIFPLLFGKLL